MKKTIQLILLIFTFSLLNAQETLDKYPVDVSEKGTFTAREVGYMAIFPGCENFDKKDKVNLLKCFSSELSALLQKELKDFEKEMEKNGYFKAETKVNFVVDKHGKIIQIKALNGGNEDLAISSEKAFHRIASKIKKINPAALPDGSPVNLVFQLPIRYQVEINYLSEFEWKEMTLATLIEGDKKYEIRQDKLKNIKVYEIQNGKETFLGKYLTTQEIFNSEPYRSILTQNNNRILMAENKIKNTEYRLYYSQENTDQIEVYKWMNGAEIFVESILQSEIVGYRDYLAVILRN